jgi:transcriptional regulator with GAF, ATPase, and Fis domain
MKMAIGRTSERFAADLEQLRKESADHIRRSFDSIVTLKDFLSAVSGVQETDEYARLVAKLDTVERKLSRFEDSLDDRVNRLIREYEKLKSEVEILAREREFFKTLYELSTMISSRKDVEVTLSRIVQLVSELLTCDQAVLQIIGDDRKVLSQYNYSSKSGTAGKFAPSKQISDAVLSTGDPVMIESGNDSDVGCIVCIPLKCDDGVSGLLHTVRMKGPFVRSEMELLKTLSEKIWPSIESYFDLKKSGNTCTISSEELRQKFQFDEIIGNSPEMAQVLAIIGDVAETESAVLIEGESGTGKELLARALHFNSKRKDNPFVTINCAAIPETLLESELFGYEKGAFTGAVARKPGRFEQANGGTVFLDEIGDLPPLLQVKLLRFLQSHEFEPLGSTGVKVADVRIISATKKNLAKMVESGEFRDDLFYRINVIAVKLPPLVERSGEIELLAQHFIKKYAVKNNRAINGIDDTATAYLNGYDFPGNVRELENIIERAVVLCKGEIITANELPDQVKGKGGDRSLTPENIKELNALKRRLWREAISPLEANFVLRLLEKSNGNISEAARLGGLHRKQLQRILKRNKLGLTEKNEEKTDQTPQK